MLGLKFKKMRKVVESLRNEARQSVVYLSKVETDKNGRPNTRTFIYMDGVNLFEVVPVALHDYEISEDYAPEIVVSLREKYYDKLKYEYKRTKLIQ